MDPARIAKAVNGLVYSPSPRDRAAEQQAKADAIESLFGSPLAGPKPGFTPRSQRSATAADHELVSRKARPWDRNDLMRRLHSFRPATWFCKPAAAGPVPCARHGWVNVATDLLACEFCGSKLSFPSQSSLSREQQQKAAEGFGEQLREKHARHCPWRGTACAAQLAGFPPQPAAAVAEGFAERAAELGRLDALPPISEEAIAKLAATHDRQLRVLLTLGPLVQPEARLKSVVGGRAAAAASGGPPSMPVQAPAGASHTADTAAAPAAAPSAAAESSLAAPSVSVGAGGEPGTGILVAAGVVPRGGPDFAQRQRLLAACGWNTRIMGFAVGAGAGGPSGERLARVEGRAGSSEEEAEVSSRQAVIYCTMCGAKHGLWTFLGGSPAVESRHLSGSQISPAREAPATAQTLPCTPVATAAQPGGSGVGRRTAPGELQGRHASRASPSGGPASAPSKGAGWLLAGLRRGTIAGGSAEGGGPATPASGPFGSKSNAGRQVFGTPARQQSRTGLSPASRPATPATTIAGGSAQWASPAAIQAPSSSEGTRAAEAPSGPFGRQPPGAGSTEPAFGRAGRAAPAFGLQAMAVSGPGRPAAGGPAFGSAAPAATAFGSAGLSVPVFGLPAMASSRNGSADASAKRGRDETAEPCISAAKRARGDTPSGTSAASTALVPQASAPPMPVAQPKPLDPLNLHRPYCPWVNCNAGEAAGEQAGRVGWRWTLDTLVPASALGHAAGEAAGAAEEKESVLERAAKLRALLSKIGASV